MFATVALQTMLNTQHAGMFTIYAICTRFHFFPSLFITVKPSAKEQLLSFYFTFYKNSLDTTCTFRPPSPSKFYHLTLF